MRGTFTTRIIPRRAVAAALLVLLTASGLPGVARQAAAGGPWGSYIAVLTEQADLTGVEEIEGRDARRHEVYDRQRETAEGTQAPLKRLLDRYKAASRVSDVRSLWVVNAIAFRAEQTVADIVRDRADVAGVFLDEEIPLPLPAQPATAEPPVGTVEWNVDKVRAPEVWADGVTGAGAVVATIDTGVNHTHPALAASYRGPCTGAPTDHSCSWFDAVGSESLPYDDHGHGTHVMGVIVGGDGPGPGSNDIGVAPGAKFIAAKAFDSRGITLPTWLLTAAQWIQAPGGDPTLAPDVVNNSWSIGRCAAVFGFDDLDPLILNAWRAAGIVPAFSAGNLGSLPGTIQSPADLALAFGVGATDSSDQIASFSGRGPACDPSLGIKPDVTAPGLNIRSSLAPGGFGAKSGTSFAAPHVAGGAALMVQAAGGSGSISVDSVETILRNTAVDLGPPGPDNTYGHGRIDLKAAVDVAGRTGVLRGAVIASGCRPTAGAIVEAENVSDPRDVRRVVADSLGLYRIPHLDGTYTVEVVEAFGYDTPSGTVTVTVPDGFTVVADLTPTPLPCGSIEGTVTQLESGELLEGETVVVEDTPIVPALTGPMGDYLIADVPEGTYVVRVLADRCQDPSTAEALVTVTGSATSVQDFDLEARRDAFGYWCAIVPGSWVEGRDILDLGGDDRWARVDLPFPFVFYGNTYTKAFVSTNGFIRFDKGSAQHLNHPIPDSSREPHLAVYPFWDDLVVGADSLVLTTTLADALVIEWRDATFFHSPDEEITFATILHRNGDIEYQYREGSGTATSGGSATIGIENANGTIGHQYSFDEDGAVEFGMGIVYTRLPTPGLLRGTVTDTSAVPLGGAAVTATTGGVPRTARTDSAGRYRLWLHPAAYSLEARLFGYAPAADAATIVAGTTEVRDFTLAELPRYPLEGTVTEQVVGTPIDQVIVEVDEPAVDRVWTDAAGEYAFSLPEGTYEVTVAPSGRCQGTRTATVVVAAPGAVHDVETTVKRDAFGYTCREVETVDIPWSQVSNTGLFGDDQHTRFDLPFRFPFYGENFGQIFVSTNGYVAFGRGSAVPRNDSIPSLQDPNNAVYPFWDDLMVDEESRVLFKRYTVGGDPQAVGIEWRNVNLRIHDWARTTFEMILRPSGEIEFQYSSGAGNPVRGSGATIGIENKEGTIALEYAFKEVAVEPGLRVHMAPARHALTGTVTDAATGNPLVEATVEAVGATVDEVLTDFDGEYRMVLAEGGYTVTASKFGYLPETQPVTMTAPAVLDFALDPAPFFTVSGFVRDAATAQPISGVPVTTDHPDISEERTAPNGFYQFDVPPGTYTVATGGRCMGSVSEVVTVTNADVTQDLDLPTLRDDSYICDDSQPMVQLPTALPILMGAGDPMTGGDLVGFDSRWIPLPLPFLPDGFPVYDQRFPVAFISTNGFISFELPDGLTSYGPPNESDPCHAARDCIPSQVPPNMAVYPFWDDLVIERAGQIRIGAMGLDTVVVDWQFARFKSDVQGTDPEKRLSIQALIHSNGDIDFQYIFVPDPRPTGSRPVVGVENAAGTKALQYPFDPTTGLRIHWRYLGPS